MSADAMTRYHVNPALTGTHDIYADGAATARDRRVLHLSGQVGIRPDGSRDFAEQRDQALINLLAVPKAAAMVPEDDVKLTCFVVGQQHLAALCDARRRHLPMVAPASTTLIIQDLAAPEWLIEIEAIAAA